MDIKYNYMTEYCAWQINDECCGDGNTVAFFNAQQKNFCTPGHANVTPVFPCV